MRTICSFLALLLLFIPGLIVLSGKATVLFLILFSAVPFYFFIKERKQIAVFKKLYPFDRILTISSITFILFYIFIFWRYDSFILFLRILILILLTTVSVDFYKNNLSTYDILNISRFYLYGIFVAMFVFVLEKLTDGSIAGFLIATAFPEKTFYWPRQLEMMNRGMCFLSMAIWPALYTLFEDFKKNKLKIITIVAALLFIIFYSESETAKLSISGTVVISVLLLKFKNKLFKPLMLMFIMFPFVFILTLNNINPQSLSEKKILIPSAMARICIWKYTAFSSLENIYGHGFDSSCRKEFTSIENKDICIEGNTLNNLGHRKFYYKIDSHPHQNALQIFFEFGIFGLILYVIGNLRVTYNILIQNSSAAFKLVMFNTFFSFTLIGLTGYGIWQNWLIAALLFNLLLVKVVQNADQISVSRSVNVNS